MSLIEFNPNISSQNSKSHGAKESHKSHSNSGLEFSKALKSVFSHQQLSEVGQAQAGVESDLKKNKILNGAQKEEYKKEEEMNLFAMIRKVEKKLEEIKKEERKLRKQS